MNWLTFVPKQLFNIFVDMPLKAFYFVGPIWRNSKPEEICYEMTGVDSEWWGGDPLRTTKCDELLDSHYTSFKTTIFCIVYFTAITVGLTYASCRCLFIKPVVKEIKSIIKCE